MEDKWASEDQARRINFIQQRQSYNTFTVLPHDVMFAPLIILLTLSLPMKKSRQSMLLPSPLILNLNLAAGFPFLCLSRPKVRRFSMSQYLIWWRQRITLMRQYPRPSPRKYRCVICAVDCEGTVLAWILLLFFGCPFAESFG